MEWKHLFQSHILNRGLNYYDNGLVSGYYEGDDCIEAVVYGNDTYNVIIDIEDGEIADMSCDCPYEGKNCKHMAAVLFYRDRYSETSLEVNDEIEKLVEKADEASIRKFLKSILRNDEKLINRFKSTLHYKINKEDMKRYKNQIDGIFNKYNKRYNYIEYGDAYSFINELLEFLDDDVSTMLNNNNYDEAFEFTNYIFIKVGNQEMDDSDGGTGLLAEKCIYIWTQMLTECNMNFKRTMFNWFKDHLNGSIIDYMEEYIERILFENFNENEFLEAKLIFSDEKIKKYKSAVNSWTREHGIENWVIKHLNVMKELKKDKSEIDEYCKAYLEFSKIRKIYIEDCINMQNYDEAVFLLKEGKVVDKEWAGLVNDYSLKLRDLYKKLGKQKEYENELWDLVLEHKTYDIDLYNELKSLYIEEEWIQKREIVFKKLSDRSEVAKLYEIEKLYDRLLKIVLDSRWLYGLEQYEKCLKDLYPDELLNKYEIMVKEMASHTSDRKQYAEIVRILRKMKGYPNGSKKVNDIVVEWTSIYKNRRAMMDELKKL